MTDHASLLRQIRQDARPYVEQWLDLSEVFTGFRKLASDNGLDWGVIKALIKAEVQDEKEGGSEKVDRIIEKADFASAYADTLGLGTKMNENNFSSAQAGVAVTRSLSVASEERAGPFVPSSSLPPHDEDGVLIEEPASHEATKSAQPAIPAHLVPEGGVSAVIGSIRAGRADEFGKEDENSSNFSQEIEPAMVVQAVEAAALRASTGSLASHAASPTRSEEPASGQPAAETGEDGGAERQSAEKPGVQPSSDDPSRETEAAIEPEASVSPLNALQGVASEPSVVSRSPREGEGASVLSPPLSGDDPGEIPSFLRRSAA